MHTLITSFNGISNIGLYAFINDKFILLGKEVPESIDSELEKIFKVPVHRITIAGTSLIGVFVAGNNNKILVPNIIFDEEKEELDAIGIKYDVFDTKLTCLGNNIIPSEKKALINPEFSDAQAKKISGLLGMPVEKKKIAGINAIGSIIAINHDKKKALASNEMSEEELVELEEDLGLTITPGSVNMGSPYIRSGVLCNKNGFAIGKISGGPELTNADEALGFLE